VGDDEEITKGDVERSAFRFLARRDHARGELDRKLRKRDFPEELIDEVLDDCIEAGYVDDEQFALDQGQMLARKSWGPKQIRKKLLSRDVDDTIIDGALESIGNDVDWQQQARQRLHRRFGEAAELDDDERQRAFRHLAYRGYAPALIRRLLFDYDD